MKHIIYFILCGLLLTSCEQEIGELTEYESPRLVVNAMLTAQQDEQPLRIRMTGLTEATRVDGAEVSLSLNGKPYCQQMTKGEDSLVVSTRDFVPGDVVGVEVRKDGMLATAQAVVPQPIMITGIDTTTVMASRYQWSNDMEPHRRLLIDLQQPEGTNPDETYYYRVEIYKDMILPSSWSVVDDRITQVIYKTDDDHQQFSFAGDPALSETSGLNQEDMAVSFDWLDGMSNLYYVMRSTYFEHGKYTLRLDFPYPFGAGKAGWAQEVRIRLYAISRTEYNYLMALSAYRSLDSETIYDSEPGITTNVVGGAGFFGVEMMTEVTFYDDHGIIKESN